MLTPGLKPFPSHCVDVSQWLVWVLGHGCVCDVPLMGTAPQCPRRPQDDTVRVLAAYGLDDTLKLDQARAFVKSVFLLQVVHPDALDVPADTIIHDLEITDVRPFPRLSLLQTPARLLAKSTLFLSSILSLFLEPRLL